jgi:hypothetical protein
LNLGAVFFNLPTLKQTRSHPYKSRLTSLAGFRLFLL